MSRAAKDISGEDNDMEKLAFDLFRKLVESHPRLSRDWKEAVRAAEGEKGQPFSVIHIQ